MLFLTTGDSFQIATLIEIYNGMADKHTHIVMHIHTSILIYTHNHTHTLAH